ncbi:MAG: LmeA family phospholipid-binding protein [Actinomycetota bacterium]|nr:LmeA family phospholipid-binding protein [Actinomycetota bacterium]
MRKLLVFLLVLAVLVGAGEFFAARFAENQIEQRLAREVDAEVEADVSSFPLVTRLMVTEEVRHMEVALTNIAFEEITFDTLTIEAGRIELPRRRLLDRNLRPTGIGSGSVTAFVSRASLEASLGASLPEIDPAATSATFEAGTLTIEIPGVPAVSVSIPEEALPCSGVGEVTGDGIRMRCDVDEIPPVVLDNLPR